MGIGYRKPSNLIYTDDEMRYVINRLVDTGRLEGAAAIYALYRIPKTDEQFDIEMSKFITDEGEHL